MHANWLAGMCRVTFLMVFLIILSHPQTSFIHARFEYVDTLAKEILTILTFVQILIFRRKVNSTCEISD